MSQTDSIHPSHFQTSPLGFRHFSGGDAIPQSLRPKTLESSSPPWSLPSPTSGPAGNPAGANLHNIASIWSHAQDTLTMKCSFTDPSNTHKFLFAIHFWNSLPYDYILQTCKWTLNLTNTSFNFNNTYLLIYIVISLVLFVDCLILFWI